MIEEGNIRESDDTKVQIVSFEVQQFHSEDMQFYKCLLFPSYFTLLWNSMSKAVLWKGKAISFIRQAK